MPITTTKSIGSGGDYTTLQAWEDAAPANLVTSDEIWRGEIKASFSFTTSNANAVTIAGSTADATRYKELTVEAGGAWCDNTANALTFDSSKGAYISVAQGYSTVIDVNENYARLSRLQIEALSNSGRCLWARNTGVILRDLVVKAFRTPIETDPATLVNCLSMITSSNGYAGIQMNGASAAYNCGSVAVHASGSSSIGINGGYPSGQVRTNCWSYGFTTGFNSHASITHTTCRSSGSESISGVTTGLTSAAFVATNPGGAATTWNLKVASTSSVLYDNGTTYSGASPDPYGTSRPQGSAYDIGAHELAAAAPSFRPSRVDFFPHLAM